MWQHYCQSQEQSVCVSKYVARFHLTPPPPRPGKYWIFDLSFCFYSSLFLFEKLCGKRSIREAKPSQELFQAEKNNDILISFCMWTLEFVHALPSTPGNGPWQPPLYFRERLQCSVKRQCRSVVALQDVRLLEQCYARASVFPQAERHVRAPSSVHLCCCCISLFSHIWCSRNHNHLYFETRMHSILHLFLPVFTLNGRVKA